MRGGLSRVTEPGSRDPLGRTRRGLPSLGLTVQHSQALGSWLCPESERPGARELEARGLRGRGGRCKGPPLHRLQGAPQVWGRERSCSWGLCCS